MGGGTWDRTSYSTSHADRTARGIPHFGYDSDVKAGRASGIHADLDPKKVAGPTSPLAGRPIRESRDSDEHPESLPIVAIFDVTGSMMNIPRVLQEKLAGLMDVIIAKAGIAHPQVLVGAVGDATVDRYPFQVGQFESDNRFDEQLRNIILEGGGGGQTQESYGLTYRFLAHHTETDSFNKRGKKGYAFSIGDEQPWDPVRGEEVSRIFGVQAGDQSVAALIAEAQKTWEVYHLFANDGSYHNDEVIQGRWRSLLGERFVVVDDSSLMCEVVAGIIHSLETASGVDKAIADIGIGDREADIVRRAIAPIAAMAATQIGPPQPGDAAALPAP